MLLAGYTKTAREALLLLVISIVRCGWDGKTRSRRLPAPAMLVYPKRLVRQRDISWIPAFAGMTGRWTSEVAGPTPEATLSYWSSPHAVSGDPEHFQLAGFPIISCRDGVTSSFKIPRRCSTRLILPKVSGHLRQEDSLDFVRPGFEERKPADTPCLQSQSR